jgi:DNA-binding MarR family transcriptional regulator
MSTIEDVMPPHPAVSELESHLGYWLRYVSNQVSQSFSRKVAAAGVSVAEWVILRELYDGEALAPSVLAAKTGMTRGGISKIADKLTVKSLVTRTQSGEDLRYQALALTAKGRALVPKLAALADNNDEEFFGHLGAAERKTIEKIMRELVRRHGLTSVPVE